MCSVTTPSIRSSCDVVPRFAKLDAPAVPVVDEEGRYRGALVDREVQRSLDRDGGDVTAGDVARDLPTLHSTDSLQDALEALVDGHDAGLPVMDGAGHVVIGWLTHHDVLRTYHARVNTRRVIEPR